jgi:hypothetical protein
MTPPMPIPIAPPDRAADQGIAPPYLDAVRQPSP